MQNNGINFTSYEQRIMKDTDFLLAKREITVKITKLFEELAKTLSSEPVYESLSEKLNIQFQGAKISKGENYRGLPYIVLDHPRFFDKNNIFTFRSMFWWGNAYSFTLHVQGRFLEIIEQDSFKKTKRFFLKQFISAPEIRHGNIIMKKKIIFCLIMKMPKNYLLIPWQKAL